MNWLEISATFDPAPEDWSQIVDLLAENGCENSLQEERPPRITTCLAELPGSDEILESIRQGLNDLGAESVTIRPVPEVDWSEVWKQHFKPRRIGNRFVIKPTWEDYQVQPGDLIIELDPGQAFGTGEHPTTRGCLELMESLDFQRKQVADVGCGSGVLSIGAHLLGAAKVSGVDIEPIAVEVALQNARDNHLEIPFITGDSITNLGDGPWDIVLSNIVSSTLIAMSPRIAVSVIPGGYWLVSGILDPNWPDVQAAAQRVGFVLERELREDGWVSAIFRR